jgi:hypothetical protein
MSEKRNRISRDEMKKMMGVVMTWVEKCEEMEGCWENCVGEAKEAYALVHKDYLWKLQRSIGQLWYFVCGSEDLNPFEEVVKAAAQKEEEEKEKLCPPRLTGTSPPTFVSESLPSASQFQFSEPIAVPLTAGPQ